MEYEPSQAQIANGQMISEVGEELSRLSGLANLSIWEIAERNGSLIPTSSESGLAGAIGALGRQQKGVDAAWADSITESLNDLGFVTPEDVSLRGVRKFIEREQVELLESASFLLASVLHDEWRTENFGNPDGTFRPRVKCLVERDGKETWVNENALNDGEEPIFLQDIANTDFKDLHPHWQKDNYEAAKKVVEIILTRNGDIDLNDKQVFAEIGDEIHSAWLQRQLDNGGWIEPGLEVSFSELSADEQAKDINQIRIAKRLFKLS